jgi:NADH-quinone oxidoreductase subunit G
VFLQDYSFRYGRAHSRFEDEKRVRPAEDLGAGVVINQNRCIMCTRCVRFTREISGTGELFVQQRGNSTKISVLEDKPLDNLLAGNVTDICPVGALLSKNYIHRNRIWNLDRQPSVCQECSVGCNVDIYHQNGEVFRTSARENLKVNGYFICDTGRYSYHDYEAVERVTSPMIRKDKKWQKISWDGAFKEIFEKLGRKKEGDSNKVAGIFSPFHTSEANLCLPD